MTDSFATLQIFEKASFGYGSDVEDPFEQLARPKVPLPTRSPPRKEPNELGERLVQTAKEEEGQHPSAEPSTAGAAL